MDQSNEAKWYVAHTYSGYENKVKANIYATVENRNMADLIHEVYVPMQEVEEFKNGKRKVNQKKIFPGYVLVKMLMTDESWYVVRNTRGVTGFVGPASKPVPLTKSELRNMGIREKMPKIDLEIGDRVEVKDGPLQGFSGVVEEINQEKHKVKVNISMFGRETPAELELKQITKK